MQSLTSLFGGGREETCFTIHGFPECTYYQRALKLGQAIQRDNKNIKITISEVNREEWKDYLKKETEGLGQRAIYHQTCPMVVEGCDENAKSFVGGFSEFLIQSKKRHYIKPTK